MDNPFYRHWFSGFGQALSDLDDQSIDALMSHCGRACSDSYSKQVYIEAYRAADTLDALIAGLNNRFGEMAARRISDDTVEIVYTRCACDLVRDGLINHPKLCQCSLKSLRYNWEAVLGEGSVDCRLEQSILGGGDCCRFIIKIHTDDRRTGV